MWTWSPHCGLDEKEAVEDDGDQVGPLLPGAGCHRARARNALVAPGHTPMSFINIHGTHCDTPYLPACPMLDADGPEQCSAFVALLCRPVWKCGTVQQLQYSV